MYQYYKITRPTTCFFVILITYLGFACNNFKNNNIIIPIIFSNVCTMASMNTINDVLDLDIDKITFPDRPIPSGKLNKYNAIIYSIILNIISLGITYLCGWYYFGINLLEIIIGILYTPILKYFNFLTKNCSIGLVSILYFLSGLTLIKKIPYYIIIWLFFDCVNYEIYKDIRDYSADRENGCITLPVKYNVNIAILVIWFNYIISSLLIIFTSKYGLILFFTRIILNLILDFINMYKKITFVVDSNFRYKKKLLVFLNLFIIMYNELI